MREVIATAFQDALDAENITISAEQFEDYIEEIIERMWMEFDVSVNEILHEELEGKR